MSQLLIKKHEKQNTKNEAFISSNHPNRQAFKIGDAYYGKIESVGGRRLIIKLNLSSDTSIGEIKITKEQMVFLSLVEGQGVYVEPLNEDFTICSAISLKAYNPCFEDSENASDIEFDESDVKFGDSLNRAVASYLMNHVLYKNQKILLKYKKNKMMLVVGEVFVGIPRVNREFGKIVGTTTVMVNKNECFRPGVDPDDLARELERRNIGGMEANIGDLIDSLCKYKYLPPDVQNELNLEPVRGVLFHGPPGTGKTLIARNLCDIILCVKPKVVNGPELMDYYIGNSEKNVRNLFAPAQKDYKKYGASSPLHVIIFDEFDSVAPKRGSGPDSSHIDAVVNQLLTMLDGITQIPNILVLATTNRIDLIDPAILRAGRIEIYIYVNYPIEAERLSILKLKLNPFRSKNLIDNDVDINELAGLTNGLSGADIGALVSRTFKLTLKETKFATLNNFNATANSLPRMNMSHFRAILGEMLKKEPWEEVGQSSGQQPQHVVSTEIPKEEPLETGEQSSEQPHVGSTSEIRMEDEKGGQPSQQPNVSLPEMPKIDKPSEKGEQSSPQPKKDKSSKDSEQSSPPPEDKSSSQPPKGKSSKDSEQSSPPPEDKSSSQESGK